jgi:DNA-binding transcriptional ArsR family regulator
LSGKSSKTVTDSIEETRLYHTRYLRAVNNPLRRKILRLLNEENCTINQLEYKISLVKETLKWHLDILEHGFCVEKQLGQNDLVYKLTQEGKVIDFLE